MEDKRQNRRAEYTLNTKKMINKKKASCLKDPIVIEMKKGNNMRITCSTTTFELVRVIIGKYIRSQGHLAFEHVAKTDKEGLVEADIIKVHDKESRTKSQLYTINQYRT